MITHDTHPKHVFPTRPELIILLDRALADPLGIMIRTTDPEKLKELLATAQATSPKHTSLTIAVPSITEHVFVGKGVPNGK